MIKVGNLYELKKDRYFNNITERGNQSSFAFHTERKGSILLLIKVGEIIANPYDVLEMQKLTFLNSKGHLLCDYFSIDGECPHLEFGIHFQLKRPN